MADCEICGSLRLNGTPIRRTDDGWRIADDPNPVDPDVKFACRSCAKTKLEDSS